jgi:hypothetical protein
MFNQGDIVILDAGYAGKSVRVISRVTKTQAIIEQKNHVGKVYERRFRQDTGLEVGARGWRTPRIYAPRPGEADEVAKENKRKTIIAVLSATQWTDLSLDQLRRIEAVLSENARGKDDAA